MASGSTACSSSLRDRLVGIVNGIDQEVWDPAHDPVHPAPLFAGEPPGKQRCRVALQRATGLSRWQAPIFALTARLVAQKGLDLILGDPGYFAFDAQYVFLGHGEERYEAMLTELAERAPSRIAVKLDFTDEFEHLLLAGADMCLMPSQYEPCGLTQMRAQRYGTIPVARRVGWPRRHDRGRRHRLPLRRLHARRLHARRHARGGSVPRDRRVGGDDA